MFILHTEYLCFRLAAARWVATSADDGLPGIRDPWRVPCPAWHKWAETYSQHQGIPSGWTLIRWTLSGLIFVNI